VELDPAQAVHKRRLEWVGHMDTIDQTRWLRKRFNANQNVEYVENDLWELKMTRWRGKADNNEQGNLS
jgi:hypothetical protein